jgi:hypothetical protein
VKEQRRVMFISICELIRNTYLYLLHTSLHLVTERVLETVVEDSSYLLLEFCYPHQTELHGMKFLQQSKSMPYLPISLILLLQLTNEKREAIYKS